MKSRLPNALAETERPQAETELQRAKTVLEEANESLRQELEERKQSEETLSASETRYRRLFETARDGVLLLDAATGNITDVNPFVLELLGYAREEVLGKKLWELGALPDVLRSQNAYRRLLQEGFIRYDDLPLETKSGRQSSVEFISNVYDVDGKGTVQCNIRVATKVKDENFRLAAAVEQAAEGVLITDLEANIQYVNPAFTKITGFERADVLGRNPRLLKSDKQDQRFYEGMWATILEGRIWAGELINRRKDGRLYAEEMTIAPVRNPRGIITNFIALKQDITQRKRAEAELVRRSEELARSNGDLQQFAYVASHDLQEPLRMITSFTQLLAERYQGKLGADADELIGYVVDGASPDARARE